MKLTKQQAIDRALEQMKDKCGTGDREMDHAYADEILCDLLTELGCEEVVKEFEVIPKWYA